MKIKISLTDYGEWSECWLETRYVNTEHDTFKAWIYPTQWSELYKSDGFYMTAWYSKEAPVKIREFVINSKNSINNDRPVKEMQKTSSIFERLLNWFNKVAGRSID